MKKKEIARLFESIYPKLGEKVKFKSTDAGFELIGDEVKISFYHQPLENIINVYIASKSNKENYIGITPFYEFYKNRNVDIRNKIFKDLPKDQKTSEYAFEYEIAVLTSDIFDAFLNDDFSSLESYKNWVYSNLDDAVKAMS